MDDKNKQQIDNEVLKEALLYSVSPRRFWIYQALKIVVWIVVLGACTLLALAIARS